MSTDSHAEGAGRIPRSVERHSIEWPAFAGPGGCFDEGSRVYLGNLFIVWGVLNMPTSRTKQFELQGALTLAEIDVLRNEIADLKLQNAKLKADNQALKEQLRDLTDPTKKAEAKAFRRSMGYE